jgi:hypothetical protein
MKVMGGYPFNLHPLIYSKCELVYKLFYKNTLNLIQHVSLIEPRKWLYTNSINTRGAIECNF